MSVWRCLIERSPDMVQFSTLQIQKEKGHLDIRKLLWKISLPRISDS